jgi:type II secretory pathway pseudopilin PulG
MKVTLPESAGIPRSPDAPRNSIVGLGGHQPVHFRRLASATTPALVAADVSPRHSLFSADKDQFVSLRRLTSAATGFSLIEIMVTVALMSLIILGLLSMFNQVQRAFRSSMTQVDVLEAGRAVTDLLVRDVEQMYPIQLPYDSLYWSTNFFAIANPRFTPLLQYLPGTSGNNGPYRTNVIETLFFTTRLNQNWTGVGYFVYPDSPDSPTSILGGVGTLYRYQVTTNKNAAVQLSTLFARAMQNVMQNGPTNMPPTMSRIADGVISFKVRAYDTNGVQMTYATWNGTNHLAFTLSDTVTTTNVAVPNAFGEPVATDEFNYFFLSNALPCSLDLEVGFLEQRILDRFKGMGAGNVGPQRDYLSNHVSEVHLFRQRIPIRNIDYTAYK